MKITIGIMIIIYKVFCTAVVLNSQHVVDDRIDEEGSKKIFECYHFVMFYVI